MFDDFSILLPVELNLLHLLLPFFKTILSRVSLISERFQGKGGAPNADAWLAAWLAGWLAACLAGWLAG